MKRTKKLTRELAFLGILVFIQPDTTTLLAQVSLTTPGTAVTQDFNTLTSGSWTNNTTLTGWYARTTATATISTYGANTGSTTTGGFYAFGVNGVNPLSDRALGYATSNSYTGTAGSGKNYLGWRLKNNTGSAIDSLIVFWTGEQWRREANTSAHTLILTYQKGSTVTDLNSGSWTSVSSTFTSPQTGSSATVLDGNAAANRVTGINARIYIDLAAGEEVMLRWEDLNDSGSDHFLTIDDVSATPKVEAVAASISVTANLDFGDQTVGTVSTEQSYPVTGTGLNAGIGVKAPAGFTVSATSGGAFSDSTSLPPAGGTVYVRFEPLLEQLYSGNIVHSSPGATPQQVAVSGTGIAAPPPGSVPVVLAAWDFSGLSNYGPSPMVPTEQASDVTVTGLSRGSGVLTGGTAASNAWGGTGWNVSDAASAASTGKYATILISPDPGYLMSLTSIEAYNVRRSSTGSTTGQWQYSLNGTDFTDIGTEITWGSNTSSPGNPQSAIDLTLIPDLQDLDETVQLVLRLLVYGGSAEGGTWYLNQFQAGSDLIIKGTLISIPDTTTFSGTGDWTEAARWSHGIPGSITHVIIDGTASLGQNASIRSIEVNASGSLTISDGDTLAVSGDVLNNGGTLSPNTGTLRMSGTLRQIIGGSPTWSLGGLILDNPQGMVLGSQLQVNKGLRLNQGKIKTVANTLTLGGSAVVQGCDSDNYVWGNLRWVVNPGDHVKHFCIGDSLRYSPVEIDLDNVSSGGILTAMLIDGPHPQLATSGLDPLRCLPYHWVFINNSIVFDQYDAIFGYPVDSAASLSASAELILERYSGSAWNALASGVSSPGEIAVTGATSFSGFQAGEPCIDAGEPVLSADNTALCPGGSTLAWVASGNLGSATQWYWYDGACSGTPVYSGDTVTLTPGVSTTYYVRGEGGCTSPGSCGTLAITVGISPTGPILATRTPDLQEICRGQVVSATFIPGNGGIGCSDSYRYSLNNGGAWSSYTPAANISTSNATTVIFQGRRAGCTSGADCSSTAWTTLSTWTTVNPPVGPSLLQKTPNLAAVCEGQEVNATANAGSGGVNCSDSLRVSLNNGGNWAGYQSGATVNTTGASVVLIQGRRQGCTPGAGCSETSWTTLAQWNINAQPVGPILLTSLPDLPQVCEGQEVSATFTAGTGGVGCTDSYRYSTDSGNTWLPYTSGSQIQTLGATTVIVQGWRSGCTSGAGCTGTAFADLSVWEVIPQPFGPSLATKVPDLLVASEGTMVSATFNPGTGGIGCTDTFRFSTDNGQSWAAYSPGTDINTTGASLILVQGARAGCDSGTGCSGTGFSTLASWLVNAPPVAPSLASKTPDVAEVCELVPLSATFTAGDGGVDCQDFYRYSIDSGDNWLTYIPGDQIVTLGPTYVLIQVRRADCLSGIPTLWTTRASWKVNPYTPVSLNLTIDEVCKGSPGFKLSGGSPLGGTYSGSGVNGSSFFPGLTSPGSRIIKYTYTNAFLCTSSATDTMVVHPLPVVNLPETRICIDAGPQLLTAGTPAGGTYSGAFISSGTFDTDAAGVGTHPVSYSFKDQFGCEKTVTGVVTVVPLPQLVVTSQLMACADDQPVALSGVTPIGGTWSGTGVVANTFHPQGLPPAVYTLTYTYKDADGCENSAAVPLTLRALPLANAGPDREICFGECVTLTVSGGIHYAWSNGSSTASVVACPQDTVVYGVTVTDAYGCSNVDEVYIRVKPVPAAVQETRQICAGECVDLIAPQGSSYNWSGGLGNSSTAVACPTQTAAYFVTVTNAFGCSRTSSYVINLKQSPQLNAGPDQAVCPGGSVHLSGTGANTYLWAGVPQGGQATVLVSPSTTTTYLLTGYGLNGCSASDQVVVTVRPEPVPQITASANSVCQGDCVQLQAGGGQSYQWAHGPASGSIEVCPQGNTTYTVTVSNQFGCSSSTQIGINVRLLPVVNAGPDTSIYIGSGHNFDQASVNVTGPFWFAWDPELTLNRSDILHPTASPVNTTLYTLQVTDAYGCKGNDQVLLTVLPIGNTLSGQVVYAAAPPFPLDGFKVVVTDVSTKLTDTATTRSNGTFYLTNLPSGTYRVTGLSYQDWGWGGVNATDALEVMRHSAGMALLSGIDLLAGDVNLAAGVNSTDALLIAKRFSGIITSFVAGDWVMMESVVSLSGSQLHHSVYQALLAGDVNASFTPDKKQDNTGRIQYDEVLAASKGSTVLLPVSLDKDASVGALSASLELPDGFMLSDVALAEGIDGQLLYAMEGRTLRIAWFSVAGEHLKAGQSLLQLELSIGNGIDQGRLTSGEVFEISDPEGILRSDLSLVLPSILVAMDAGLDLSSYPNPFKGETTLRFHLPEEGKVKVLISNILGEVVTEMHEEFSAGEHTITYVPTGIGGVYLCQLIFQGSTRTLQQTIRIIEKN